MTWVAVAIGGSAVLGYMGSKEAASAQEAASEAGIQEQRRQFDLLQKTLAPYTQAGVQALGGYQPFIRGGLEAYQQQMNLAGVAGPEAQRAAIAQIEQSPEMQAMIQQGEEAMLQRASATGGLRGGNIQAAMAQFRPELLSKMMAQRQLTLSDIAGKGFTGVQNLSQLGQSSAAGVGTSGMTMASNVGNLLAQGGAAQAGGAMALGQAAGMIPGALMLNRFLSPAATSYTPAQIAQANAMNVPQSLPPLNF